MSNDMLVPEITVNELKSRIDKGQAPVIVDVREPHELQIAALPKTEQTVHIPLGQLPGRVAELDKYKDTEVVVYCRSGGRSEKACQFLRQHGFKSIANLRGGILAWSRDIDQTVPQY